MRNDFLAHGKKGSVKKNHKYLSRVWRNGHWDYTYEQRIPVNLSNPGKKSSSSKSKKSTSSDSSKTSKASKSSSSAKTSKASKSAKTSESAKKTSTATQNTQTTQSILTSLAEIKQALTNGQNAIPSLLNESHQLDIQTAMQAIADGNEYIKALLEQYLRNMQGN